MNININVLYYSFLFACFSSCNYSFTVYNVPYSGIVNPWTWYRVLIS